MRHVQSSYAYFTGKKARHSHRPSGAAVVVAVVPLGPVGPVAAAASADPGLGTTHG